MRWQRECRIDAIGPIVLALAVALQFSGCGDSPDYSSPIPRLSVIADDLDFGEADVQESFVHEFSVSNQSDHPIVVERINSSCQCTAVNPSAFVLPPGGQQTVRVTINLVASPTADGSEFSRQFVAELRPHIIGDPSPPPIWQITGRVRSLVFVPGNRFVFDDSLISSHPFPTGRFQVRCQPSVCRLDADCDSSKANVTIAPALDLPNSFEVTIAPQPTLSTGPFEFTVALHPHVLGKGAVVPVKVQVLGASLTTQRSFRQSRTCAHRPSRFNCCIVAERPPSRRSQQPQNFPTA